MRGFNAARFSREQADDADKTDDRGDDPRTIVRQSFVSVKQDDSAGQEISVNPLVSSYSIKSSHCADSSYLLQPEISAILLTPSRAQLGLERRNLSN